MDRYKETIDTYNKLASAYQDKFMDLELYNDTYDRFCELIKKEDACIFEIGCGPGNITRYLLSKHPGFKLMAIDAAPNMIELARKNNPEADFKIMDCRKMEERPSGYEGIICGFCMPYLSKEESAKLINDCSVLLKPGGIFYFSTIEGEYSKSGFETSSNGEHKVYVYYHEEKYLRELLKQNNFELLELKRKEYLRGEELTYHMIFIAKKNEG
jgi:2-polyprenyl-3-methyl-5-hydroxy-6-metoxy-1,4-benzoquinol methylase